MWLENKTVKFLLLCFAMALCVCLGWKIGSDIGTASGYEAGYAEGRENPSDKTENSIYQRGYNKGYDAGLLAGSKKGNEDKTYTEQYFDALNSRIVYVTKDGEKYHQKGCQYLQNSCIEVTLKTAKDLGYTPCSVCW